MSWELIDKKDEKYPPELGISDGMIYKANMGEIINKLKAKIEELEARILELENR
jgi:hypothetical protein